MLNIFVTTDFIRLFALILLIAPSTSFSVNAQPIHEPYARVHPRDLARRTNRFARIASHVSGALKATTGFVKQRPVQVFASGKTSRPSYTGQIPAHKDEIPPKELSQYAAAANQHLGLDKTRDHIMGAGHNLGGKTVYLESIPRGPDHLKTLKAEGGTHPILDAAMKKSGQDIHHAETAVTNAGMLAEKSKTAKGWSVGQSGQYSNGDPVLEPCKGKCQKTFDEAGVAYHDRKGNVKPSKTEQ